MTTNSILKTIISIAASFVLLLVLIEAMWGVTTGVFIGAKMGLDKETQEAVSRILKDKGIKETDTPKSTLSDEEWYKHLPPEVQKDVENVIKLELQAIDWFAITLIVSAFVFGIVGFLFGLVNKRFFFVGITVILSFIVNNPTVRFAHAKDLSVLQKSIVIVLAQFGISYLFGYLGTLVSKRRNNK